MGGEQHRDEDVAGAGSRFAVGLGAGAFAGLMLAVFAILLSDRDLTAAPLTALQDLAISAIFLALTGAVIAGLGALVADATAAVFLRGRGRQTRHAVAAALCLLGALAVAGVAGADGLELPMESWPVAVSALALCGAALGAGARWTSCLSARIVLVGFISAVAIGASARLIATGSLPGGPAGVSIAVVVGAPAGTLTWLLTRHLFAAADGRCALRTTCVPVLTVLVLTVLIAGGVGIGGELAALAGIDPDAVRAAGREAGGSANAPSIVLISVDTLRPDFLGFNDGPARTPNIDGLARQSTVFDRTWSVAPWTRPSFASFFTSLYPSEVGQARRLGVPQSATRQIPRRWRDDRPRLSELLRDAGYFTAGVVTNPQLCRDNGAARGFQFYHHCSADEMMSRLSANHAWNVLEPLGFVKPERNELERGDHVTARATEFIHLTERRPLLLWVHYMDPHQPYDPPGIPADERVVPDPSQISAAVGGRIAHSAREREGWIRAYTAEIDFHDRCVGRLLDALRAEDLLEDAIVILWSDHGEEFWEHGGWEHGHTLYDEVVRVPLIIHMPGQSEMRRVRQPVSLVDVMPTLLQEAGAELPDTLRGRPLQPALDGGDLGEFRCRIEACLHGSIRKALLTDRYKLIYDVSRDEFELYDLQADPEEAHNIHGTPMAPDTQQMEQDLLAWTRKSLRSMSEYVGRVGAREVPPEIRQQLRDMGYIQ